MTIPVCSWTLGPLSLGDKLGELKEPYIGGRGCRWLSVHEHVAGLDCAKQVRFAGGPDNTTKSATGWTATSLVIELNARTKLSCTRPPATRR
jgi:hypothetical protein